VFNRDSSTLLTSNVTEAQLKRDNTWQKAMMIKIAAVPRDWQCE